MQTFGIVLFAVAIGVVSLVWSLTRSHQLIQDWADANMYRVIESHYAAFFRGPFFWTTAKGQSVYRIVVEDRTGQQHRGWLKCGSWWGGLLSDNVEVRWDD